ncbi:hypothetical protein [Elizabethkingia anophelis]|uniref:hypothetical protein n=1 Tax=Elizabethkingia anophelis TaxID=1117645 RepID=UPI0038927108
MKKKYIAVPVSERLPINGKYIIGIKMEPQSTTNGKVFPENLLLEELPDHSEEMLSLLENVKLFFQPHPHFAFTDDQESTLKQIEELINKVKGNG